MNATTIRQALKIQQKIDTLTRQRDTLLNGANGSNGEVPKKSGTSEATRRLQSRKKKQWWKNHRAEMAAKKK